MNCPLLESKTHTQKITDRFLASFVSHFSIVVSQNLKYHLKKRKWLFYLPVSVASFCVHLTLGLCSTAVVYGRRMEQEACFHHAGWKGGRRRPRIMEAETE